MGFLVYVLPIKYLYTISSSERVYTSQPLPTPPRGSLQYTLFQEESWMVQEVAKQKQTFDSSTLRSVYGWCGVVHWGRLASPVREGFSDLVFDELGEMVSGNWSTSLAPCTKKCMIRLCTSNCETIRSLPDLVQTREPSVPRTSLIYFIGFLRSVAGECTGLI